MNDTDRRALIARTVLGCPLCPNRPSLTPGDGAQDERYTCRQCRVVVKLPRVALAAAIKRSGRA